MQEWISEMDPTDWGLEITDKVMYPVLTDIAAAPFTSSGAISRQIVGLPDVPAVVMDS